MHKIEPFAFPLDNSKPSQDRRSLMVLLKKHFKTINNCFQILSSTLRLHDHNSILSLIVRYPLQWHNHRFQSSLHIKCCYNLIDPGANILEVGNLSFLFFGTSEIQSERMRERGKTNRHCIIIYFRRTYHHNHDNNWIYIDEIWSNGEKFILLGD